MNEQNQRDSIMSMARGAFEERVDYEMDKVIQNILDPNTKATAKRKITLKETKIFEINGQTYADASLTRIPPHVDRPDCISVSGLDSICKLIRTELEKVGTTIMVQVKSNDTVEVMTTYLSDFSRNTLYRAKADAPGLRTGFRGREVALIELRSLCIPNEGTRPTCSTC